MIMTSVLFKLIKIFHTVLSRKPSWPCAVTESVPNSNLVRAAIFFFPFFFFFPTFPFPGISIFFFFLPWMANSWRWGLLSCQIPRGGDKKRGRMPRPSSTLQHLSLIAQSNSAVLSISMCDFLFQLTSSFVIALGFLLRLHAATTCTNL